MPYGSRYNRVAVLSKYTVTTLSAEIDKKGHRGARCPQINGSFICSCRSRFSILLSQWEDTTCWRAVWVLAKDVPVFLNHHTQFFQKKKEKGLKSYSRHIGGSFSLSAHGSKPFTQENFWENYLWYTLISPLPGYLSSRTWQTATTVLSSIRSRLLFFSRRRSTVIVFCLSSFR